LRKAYISRSEIERERTSLVSAAEPIGPLLLPVNCAPLIWYVVTIPGWIWPYRSATARRALDARAEYEVFLGFSELTKGRMAVLVSHRFSTVRMADRILVLKGGELVEQGTHEALVALGGLYSELFQLQAAGYR
jgi:hypothetical protein